MRVELKGNSSDRGDTGPVAYGSWLTPGRRYDCLAAVTHDAGVDVLLVADSGGPYFWNLALFDVVFGWWPPEWRTVHGDLRHLAHHASGANSVLGYTAMLTDPLHYENLLNDEPEALNNYRAAVTTAVGDGALLRIALDVALELDGKLDSLMEVLVSSGEHALARQELASQDPQRRKPGLRVIADALALLDVDGDAYGA